MTSPPTTSDLATAAAEFRAALLRMDAAALRRLMAAYQPAYERMQSRVAELTTEIAKLRAQGERIRPEWLREQRRLEILQRQIREEWTRYADSAAAIITEAQRELIQAGANAAEQMTLAALDDGIGVGVDVARLNTGAMRELVGVLGDGSPVKTLLDALGLQAAQEVGDALKHAIAVGRNPRQTARDIRAALGSNLNRALTIARTGQIRAYRTASLQTYQANSALLRGWRWQASPSRRTCPLCLAMDGREFGLDEPFASHPNCRCTPIPILKNRPTPAREETGAQWFARQDAATQQKMLGPGAYALYSSGKIDLEDLVEIKQDPRWGPTLRRRSLKELQEAADPH